MSSITRNLRRFKWYQWLLSGLVFVYLVYIALSYFYLPGKLKRITETDVSGLIGREISADTINFNPFILSLTVNGFAISDESEKSLVAWEQVFINFSFWKSLFSWGVVLDELKLDKPEINIIKDRTGFNFEDIIDNLSSKKKGGSGEEKPAEKTSISIEIFNTSINKGSFEYSDISGKAPVRSNLDEISIVINELYFATGEKHLNPFDITASIPGGGQLHLEGNYRIQPLHLESNISADRINLSEFSGFLENIIPVKMSEGRLSFSTKILAEQDDRFHIKAEQGVIIINNLSLDDYIADPEMLTMNDMRINDLTLDISGKRVNIGDVVFDGITANQWIDEEGNMRYEKILPEQNQVKNEEPLKTSVDENNADIPWNIYVEQISLIKSRVNFSDKKNKISREHSLSGIDLNIKKFTLTPEKEMSVQMAALLDEKGKITVEGSMILKPFTIDLHYGLEDIVLETFSEYLEETSYLKLETGLLSIDGDITGKAPLSLTASAKAGLYDFKIKDTRSGNPLFSFEGLELDDIKANIDKKNISTASVNLLKPELHFEISEQKEINLSGLFKPQKPESKKASPEQKPDGSPGWMFHIGKVNLQEGAAYYSDRSIKPAYKTGLYNMTLAVDEISSDTESTSPFSFSADIDKYAPFTIKGELDPIDMQPGFEFTSTLKGLEMPHLSPYSAIFIGNNLKSGKLDLNLDYSLHDRKLKGKNNIVAKNLYLGDKVPGEPVIKAPVGLGLALMRDISGVIDLNLGISGDLDDPGFSISGIIIKVITNIFVKAAASPFKLLGALIPGGNEQLGEIVFDPGISGLNSENKDRLKILEAALEKRPQIALNIKGNASVREDINALKIASLKQLVAEKRGVELTVLETEIIEKELWAINENFEALNKINDDFKLPLKDERAEKIKGVNPEIEALELQEMIAKQIFEDILTSLEVKENELLFLADQRALSIKQYLVDELKLGHERVSVIKAGSSDLSGRVIKLSLDAM